MFICCGGYMTLDQKHFTNYKRGQPGPEHDPINLMHQVFEDATEFNGPAQDILLSWLMKLSESVKPDDAARLVLNTTVKNCDNPLSPESQKLVCLLEQVCDCGRDKNSGVSTRGRRGGRAARFV